MDTWTLMAPTIGYPDDDPLFETFPWMRGYCGMFPNREHIPQEHHIQDRWVCLSRDVVSMRIFDRDCLRGPVWWPHTLEPKGRTFFVSRLDVTLESAAQADELLRDIIRLSQKPLPGRRHHCLANLYAQPYEHVAAVFPDEAGNLALWARPFDSALEHREVQVRGLGPIATSPDCPGSDAYDRAHGPGSPA